MFKGEIVKTSYGYGKITKVSGKDYYVSFFECDLIWIFEKSELSEAEPLLKELF